MDVDEAIALAKAGKAVLFTGAGFSFGAKNSVESLNNEVPAANAFSKHLGDLAGVSQDYPLNTMAQYFKKSMGEHRLLDELISCFNITQTSESHRQIATVPWRRVYTTNYDNCFEKAASEVNRSWTPITTEHGVSAARNRIVHINGHIFDLGIRQIDSQIKLTHTSYSMDSFIESQWAQQLRQDFDTARAVIFIGYSLADLDVSRVLRNIHELSKKTVFIVSPKDDEISSIFLQDYGAVSALGVDGFAAKISDIEAYQSESEHEYTWLQAYQAVENFKKPSDSDCFNLLTKGILRDEKLSWSLSNIGAPENNYVVKRQGVEYVLDQISSGRRWFLIHSDMGNGKSIFKSQVSVALNQLNYKIFWDTEVELNKKNDLDQLARDDGKIAVFLDETSNRFEAIDGLLSLNLPNIAVFVSARSTLYELGERIYEEYLPDDYLAIDLNKLTNSEADDFARILDNLGLWGGIDESRSLSNRFDRSKFISQDCEGSVSKLIMTLFEESELGARFVAEARQFLLNRSKTSRIVTLSFLLNVIGHSPTFELLSKIADLDAWDVARSDEFKVAREFISVSNNRVMTRSSVLSSYLLKEAFEPSEIVWHIKEIVTKLGAMRRDSTMHHVFTELQRFPMIERVVKGRNSRLAIIAYFEGLKEDVPLCKDSPEFWMHYAMARMTYEEWDLSEAHFKQARKIAKESRNQKAMRDIQNHYAKFLIISRTKSDQFSDYFEAFQNAHGVLIQQMNKDSNKHFPYRQAGEYVEFISNRRLRMNEAELQSFVNACRQVKSAINNIQGSLKDNRIVVNCDLKMDRAIDIAQLGSSV